MCFLHIQRHFLSKQIWFYRRTTTITQIPYEVFSVLMQSHPKVFNQNCPMTFRMWSSSLNLSESSINNYTAQNELFFPFWITNYRGIVHVNSNKNTRILVSNSVQVSRYACTCICIISHYIQCKSLVVNFNVGAD